MNVRLRVQNPVKRGARRRMKRLILMLIAMLGATGVEAGARQEPRH